jgi:hypothetical protein
MKTKEVGEMCLDSLYNHSATSISGSSRLRAAAVAVGRS